MQAVSVRGVEQAEQPNLRAYNGAMAVLHFVQGIAILLLSNSYALPVTTAFLVFNEDADKLLPEPNELFEVQLAPLIAAFLFVSAFAALQRR